MPHDIIDDILKDDIPKKISLDSFPPDVLIKEQQRTNKLLEEILKKLSEIEQHKK